MIEIAEDLLALIASICKLKIFSLLIIEQRKFEKLYKTLGK